MFSVVRVVVAALVATFVWAGSAEAGSITCPNSGTYGRTGTLDSALACVTMSGQTGTPSATTVASAFPSGPWTNEGVIAGTPGTNGQLSDDWLTLNVMSGTWGALPVGGTWAINPLFWGTYGRAVISFHLGNGNPSNPNADPDYFFFEIEPGQTQGTWSFAALPNNFGGGFSNGNLWGTGLPTQECTEDCVPVVPEPASLLLFGTGLAALAVKLRRRKG